MRRLNRWMSICTLLVLAGCTGTTDEAPSDEGTSGSTGQELNVAAGGAFTKVAGGIVRWPGPIVLAPPPPPTLDFEDVADYASVDAYHYSKLGIVIPNGGSVDVQPRPHAGAHAFVTAHGEFTMSPLILQFTAKQSKVSLFGGASDPSASVIGTLTAYDDAGNVVATDGPKATDNQACNTPFSVQTATTSIRRVEFHAFGSYQGGALYEEVTGIDDVTIVGESAPPVPTTAPVIQITSPAAAQAFQPPAALTIGGSVTGDGLLATADLLIAGDEPPNVGHLPPAAATLALVGSGNSRTFTTSMPLPLGPVTITVHARNTGGLDASTQVHVTNFPPSVTAAIAAGGGNASLGATSWAYAGNQCQIFTFANGAITQRASGGAPQIITGDIFKKWSDWALARYGSIASTNLDFCASGPAESIAGATKQTFASGAAIYGGMPAGAFFVPSALESAILALGGNAVNGVPIADPSASPTAHVSLFQRFARPGSTAIPSTFEIKGDAAPTLWVERPGADLSALHVSNLDAGPGTAAVFESFPCAGSQGPCTVVPAQSSAPVSTTGAICASVNEPLGGVTPEWVSISRSQVSKPLLGYVMGDVDGDIQAPHLADADDAATHDTCIASATQPCRSDWDLSVAPLDPFKSLLRAGGEPAIELEMEYAYMSYYFGLYGLHMPGDLLFVAGRWIVDCGHNKGSTSSPSFDTEIHPPSVWATSRMAPGASPATNATLFVDGYYHGDAVTTTLWPPPRPTPNAFMVVNSTVDRMADVTVTSAPDADDSSFVQMNISASLRDNAIDGASGKMTFLPGRELLGRWTIGWQTHDTLPVVTKLDSAWWPN